MSDPSDQFQTFGMHLANIGAAALAMTAWVGVIPPMAALFAIILYGIQIWESRTVQGWLNPEPPDHQPHDSDDEEE